jgi:hypothetical protein
MKSIARWLAVAAGVIVVGWVGYRVGQGDLFSQARPGAGGGASGWTTHEDPAGFAVALPRGWQARADGTSGRAVASGPDGAQIVMWPVFVLAGPKSGNASGAPATAALEQLARQAFPNAEWERPQTTAQGAARLAGRDGERRLAANFAWVQSPRGMAGTFYCVAAPGNLDAPQREMYARILESFTVAGAAAGEGAGQPARPPMRYVRWNDPNESAFSLEVPAEWRAEGGLFRFASVDTRTAVVATSPDGALRIATGDSRIPTFAVPNQTLAFAGFTEGRWYSPGYGVQMLVRRFLPGTAFAADYVQGQMGQSCGGLAIDRQRDRADAVEAINRVNAQYGNYGVSVQMTAGEVAFGCSAGGAAMRGYYYATTQLTQATGMGLWSVPYLYGYLAPSAREGEAQQVLSHMIESTVINPQWVAMQQGLTANTSAIVADTNRAITKIISQSFERTQAVMDELDRRRSNATRGVVDVTDPVSGRDFQVESGSNYYWIDHRGNIVGTDVYNQPTIDFREMMQLP